MSAKPTDDAATTSFIEEIIVWILNDRAKENLDAIEVKPDTALLDEAVFDSMKILDFVQWLETTYGIVVGVEALTPEFFASPRSIATEVQRLQAATVNQAN